MKRTLFVALLALLGLTACGAPATEAPSAAAPAVSQAGESLTITVYRAPT